MSETTYFEEGPVKVTGAFIQGKSGTYDLDGVLGIESKPPVLRTSIMVLIGIVDGFFVINGHGGLLYAALIVGLINGGVLITSLSSHPVFVRTGSGLVSLGSSLERSDREKLVAAFSRAKKAASRKH